MTCPIALTFYTGKNTMQSRVLLVAVAKYSDFRSFSIADIQRQMRTARLTVILFVT